MSDCVAAALCGHIYRTVRRASSRFDLYPTQTVKP
jgi:hypothetical protein